MAQVQGDEDLLVVVEFSADCEFAKKHMEAGKPYTIENMETSTPVLKIGRDTYHGAYEDTVGTIALFEKPGDGGAVADAGNSCGAPYVGKSTKRLVFAQAPEIVSDRAL